MKERPYYLHFEGMDLAGKTTATQNFIKSTNSEWEIRRNSLSSENPIHRLADSLRKAEAYDAEVLGNLYVAALMNDEKKTQREVADIAGITEVTIRNRYKELIEKLKLQDKIKEKEVIAR